MNSEAKERPILFAGPMVRAILDGRKTQTRRVVKGVPDNAVLPRYYDAERAPRPELAHTFGWFVPEAGDAWPMNDDDRLRCPYGQPGDRLWVRETFSYPHDWREETDGREVAIWRWADGNPMYGDWTPPKPSIHMPRWACRLVLEVTAVRVERLQEITVGDCRAEGMDAPLGRLSTQFAKLWNSLNEKRGYGWDSNPWVWVIEFKRVEQANEQ